MPIRLSNLRLPVDAPEAELPAEVAGALALKPADIRRWRILRKSLDVRDKQVTAALASLRQLSDMQVSIDLPNALESMDAVRNQKLVRERGLR